MATARSFIFALAALVPAAPAHADGRVVVPQLQPPARSISVPQIDPASARAAPAAAPSAAAARQQPAASEAPPESLVVEDSAFDFDRVTNGTPYVLPSVREGLRLRRPAAQ